MNISKLFKESSDKTVKKELDIFDIIKNKNSSEKPKASRPFHTAFQSILLLYIKSLQKEIHLQEYLMPFSVNTWNTKNE